MKPDQHGVYIGQGPHVYPFYGWLLLISTLALAVVSATVIVGGHLHPQIGSHDLLKLTTFVGRIAFGALAFSLLFGFMVAIIRKFWHSSRWAIGSLANLPWYLHMCKIVAVVAFFEIFLSSSATVQFSAGQWMMAGGRGYPWQEVSEQAAVACLWGNLRSDAALLLFISMVWMLFAGALITEEEGKQKMRRFPLF